MTETLMEKYNPLVIEIAEAFLDNMEKELGKKYKKKDHQVNAGLSDAQYSALKTKYNVPNAEFADLYLDFKKMKPTEHLTKVMEAFAASGGAVDVEPVYDEESQRLKVKVNFVINDQEIDRIEGLAPIEDLFLRMNAMIQVETALSGSDPDAAPAF